MKRILDLSHATPAAPPVFRARLLFCFFAVIALLAVAAQASPAPASAPSAGAKLDCSQLPPVDPTKTFFGNFINSCYGIALQSKQLPGLSPKLPGGLDPHATYSQLFYRILPGYQLVIYGTFPQTRYFSIATYDDHEALLSSVLDANIQPYSSAFVNPYKPGVAFVDGQKYVVTVSLGGAEGTVQPGCSLGTDALNPLDGASRHSGMNWNGDPAVPNFWPAHDDGPSRAGYILVRRYQNQDVASKVATPLIFVRDLSTGCPVSADVAANVLQIETMDTTRGSSWLDESQAYYHGQYGAHIQTRLCYANDSTNLVAWRRSPEYVAGNNPDGAYINSQKLCFDPPRTGLMRIRFRLPAMPKIPCTDGCSLTGQEQLRYWSLAFMAGTTSVAAVSDVDLHPDPDGYVTLIVGLGGVPPAYVTPQNGYTYLDISQVPGFKLITGIWVRNILPAPSFNCDAHQVDFLTTEFNSIGGFMGEYVPTVDWVLPSSLPTVATPLIRPNSCALAPPEQPAACAAR